MYYTVVTVQYGTDPRVNVYVPVHRTDVGTYAYWRMQLTVYRYVGMGKCCRRNWVRS